MTNDKTQYPRIFYDPDRAEIVMAAQAGFNCFLSPSDLTRLQYEIARARVHQVADNAVREREGGRPTIKQRWLRLVGGGA